MGLGSSTPGGTTGGQSNGGNNSSQDSGDNDWQNQLIYNDPLPEQGFDWSGAGYTFLQTGNPLLSGFTGANNMIDTDYGMTMDAYGNPTYGTAPTDQFNDDGTAGGNIFSTSSSAITPTGTNMYDTDRVNSNTPFGSINYTVDENGVTTGNQTLSPELQNLFNMQFDPNAYQQYGDDYMDNARRYLDPVYAKQDDRFQQRMANRGQPEGGELYNDIYQQKQLSQNTGWQNAAFGATQASQTARDNDFNRLMAAMGMSDVPTQNSDMLGIEQLQQMLNMNNANIKSNESSDIWNTLSNLGSSWLRSRNSDDDKWWT